MEWNIDAGQFIYEIRSQAFSYVRLDFNLMISQRRNDPGQLSEDAMLAIINGWAGAGLAVAIHLTARPRVMRISGWIQLIMFTLHTGEAVTAASHNVRQPQQFSGGWLHPPTTLSHLWHAQTQTRWRNIRSVLMQLSILIFSCPADHLQIWQSFTMSF